MLRYALFAGLGLLVFTGALLADRAVIRHAALARIEPSLALACFASKTLGMMIAAAGLGVAATAALF